MIKRKQFKKGDFKKKINIDRNMHPISMLLKNNKNYAMKAKEIAKKTKMNINTVRTMLRGLKRDGLVIHKAPYFAWK